MKIDDGITAERSAWSFGAEVAEAFPGHAGRSIPYYRDGHELICYLSDFFVAPNSTVYDLGCSTGGLLKKLAAHNRHKPEVRWLGLDKEQAMIDRARKTCAGLDNVELHCEDILTCAFDKPDMIIAYYTVQFIEERHRQALIDKIYQALNWGGAFILFEKVGAPDSRFQDMMSCLYREFKQRNGFSSEEILNKEISLKGVLKPFSTAGNLGLLNRAGFTDVMSVMKYVSFEGFLAIR